MADLKKSVDYIIVGHGLAGSSLKRALEQLGNSCLLVASEQAGQASTVASGMWNPLTFRLLLKSWRVDDLLPVALQFYEEVAAIHGLELCKSLNILRAFPDAAAALRWEERLLEPDYAAYVRASKIDSWPEALIQKQGYGWVNGAGWLNINAYLSAEHELWKKDGSMLYANFNANDLQWQEEQLQWQGISCSKVIFCRGQFERFDSLFNWLPLKPAQGDVLSLRIPNLKLEQIYNAGFFILPLGDDRYRLGATYEWEQLSEQPTESGKQTLLEKFEAAYSGAYELIDHLAGIRPTVADRRPLLGLHPENERLGIFNGLGTKGVMIAPYFAKQLAEYLTHQMPIEDEVHIKRFRKRYEQHTGKKWKA